ncbi:barstar family protein [Amycolatopsis sp. NPDC049252]|uniref:barstar family protein n=1 Tax=Amycolatopsis sp. NPDC049252 TaxID=3363933 RepID=UPI00372484D0
MHRYEPRNDLAFTLLRDGPVTLFWRPQLLTETTEWLAEHDYQVTRLSAREWTSDLDMHTAVAAALDFPDYYGQNLDALNDCLRDVVAHDYGWSPDSAGLAIVFTGYDAYAARSPRSAQIVLDLLASHSRVAMLFGRPLVVLVQSDDPDVLFEPVGASPVLWNRAEWLNANRRPENA